MSSGIQDVDEFASSSDLETRQNESKQLMKTSQ